MLYLQAAEIIETAKTQKKSVKSLIYACQSQNFRKLYALVNETLKYASIIDEILKCTRLLELEKCLSQSLAQIYLYELLFGKGLHGNKKAVKAVLRHKTSLNAALARLKIKAKVSRNEDLLAEEVKMSKVIPRYVRVNTLKTSMDDVIQHFTAIGYKCILTVNEKEETCSRLTADELSVFQKGLLKRLESKSFCVDVHLPFLLVFPHGCDLHTDPLYLKGDIILQDKASCIPAHVLNPPAESHVIDACAAPGNKTSHLASIMNNTGKIYAFDLDVKRLKTLERLTSKAGVGNIEAKHRNFLKDVSPSDPKFQNVEYILVDPSCSGSGMVNRLDHVTNNTQSESQERLESLALFQASILKHALSFPAVKRVVYSTCSVHKIENEDVVGLVLKEFPDFEITRCLPLWCKRGLKSTLVGENCLRAAPAETFTNGFFVALFNRKEKSRGTSAVKCEEQNTKRKNLKRKMERKRSKEEKINSSEADEAVSLKEGDDINPKKKKKRIVK
ncbi:probable 28S rRNA (cytosine-C(5))-methyltransferase [Anneissia japonica]|uniref:probable 28S rRNA (cytosine-C(5))-methyltransferase n=1 Tax=Anneissia japonica TaxID=1529436 RepID=UPI001425A39D|nr:probable 28S rRNA (cytosine-C(5))-methyltransferase [Anneissia japonica]